MPHFDVKVGVDPIQLLQFAADNGQTRNFTLESFEMFVEQLPPTITEDYKLYIGSSLIPLSSVHYGGFLQNCRNLLHFLKSPGAHDPLSLKNPYNK